MFFLQIRESKSPGSTHAGIVLPLLRQDALLSGSVPDFDLYEVSSSFTLALTVLTWLLARSVPKSDLVIFATCSLSHKLQMLNTLSLC